MDDDAAPASARREKPGKCPGRVAQANSPMLSHPAQPFAQLQDSDSGHRCLCALAEWRGHKSGVASGGMETIARGASLFPSASYALECPKRPAPIEHSEGGMAAVNRIIDISEEAVAARRRRRRTLLRIGVPILGVILVIAAILAIALYSHSANRRGVLALSDDLLSTLDAQIAQRALAFLDPCERALRIMRDIAVDLPMRERSEIAERFAISVLKELPQIAS